jgi:hypothetical protein
MSTLTDVSAIHIVSPRLRLMIFYVINPLVMKKGKIKNKKKDKNLFNDRYLFPELVIGTKL